MNARLFGRAGTRLVTAVLAIQFLAVGAGSVWGRPPIRRSFFDVYPSAENSRLDDVPSNAAHCGACHFDFDGGGARNP